MLDMRTDGTIGIDFDTDDGPRQVVIRRPKFGAYRRLKAEQASIARALVKARDHATASPEMSDEEQVALVDQANDLVIDWWRLVLHGDDTFAALAEPKAPPVEDWPPYLVFGANVVGMTLQHWTEVPLVRGGEPVREPTA